MIRSTPLRTRTPLRRYTPLRARTRPRATRRPPEAPRPLRHGVCALCGRTALVHGHHRLLRSQGGNKHPELVIDLCAGCHHDVHHAGSWSYRHGWLLHRWQLDVTPWRCPTTCQLDHRETP